MHYTLVALHRSLPAWLQRATSWSRVVLMPTLAAAAVNMCLGIICGSTVLCAYLYFRLPAVEAVSLVSVDPESHVIDRAKGDTLTVVRRVIMRRAATVQVIRVWIDANGGLAPSLDDYQPIEAGTHERNRVQVAPPLVLNPGPYRYRVSLRTCDPFCSTVQLEDIEVLILGLAPVEMHPRWQEHRF